jgi:hypothetical protein
MLQPSKALLRCQKLMPELNLDIEQINSDTVAISKIDMKRWRHVYYKCLAYVEAIQDKVDEFPDTEPFFGLSEAVEDLGALVHSLFIFYDFTMRERDRYRDRG